ncbi:MAG: fused MFS/spermidine synthase, partial [Deltaproteobacteria bacterium]|nr:fused MFS/spermidine synthase [Deltaproteobacteria bacterium]
MYYAAAAQRQPMNLVAYLCFFLSGTSSLIFQAEWARMLHHVFGSTSIAISSVVSVFMGGLGLGSWLFGKYADRIKHPLMTYAAAEVGVAVCALVIPFLVANDGFLLDVNASLRESFGNNTYLFAFVRFLCIVPILLVPTTLMGSTLPLLARHFVQHETRRGNVGAGVGALYAINTTGALAGTFLGGFVYLPGVGLSASNVLAACINLGLAALIWIFRKQLLEGSWRPGERIEILPAKEITDRTVPDEKAVAADKAADEKILASFTSGSLPTMVRAAILVLVVQAVLGVLAIASLDSGIAQAAGYATVVIATLGSAGLFLGWPI